MLDSESSNTVTVPLELSNTQYFCLSTAIYVLSIKDVARSRNETSLYNPWPDIARDASTIVLIRARSHHFTVPTHT